MIHLFSTCYTEHITKQIFFLATPNNNKKHSSSFPSLYYFFLYFIYWFSDSMNFKWTRFFICLLRVFLFNFFLYIRQCSFCCVCIHVLLYNIYCYHRLYMYKYMYNKRQINIKVKRKEGKKNTLKRFSVAYSYTHIYINNENAIRTIVRFDNKNEVKLIQPRRHFLCVFFFFFFFIKKLQDWKTQNILIYKNVWLFDS